MGAAVALFVLVLFAVGRNPENVRLGDDVYKAGRADALAEEVADRGPILIADASPRRERDIYLQHLGDEDDEGWLAFAAQPDVEERACYVQWVEDEEEFADRCTGERFPADGDGLTQYEVTVVDGRLEVDLR